MPAVIKSVLAIIVLASSSLNLGVSAGLAGSQALKTGVIVRDCHLQDVLMLFLVFSLPCHEGHREGQIESTVFSFQLSDIGNRRPRNPVEGIGFWRG